MIAQSVALEHLRAALAAASGRPVYAARVGTDIDLPYGILYVLPVALRPQHPLSNDPGPWRIELQHTSVGRNLVDATWLDSVVDNAMAVMAPPAGYADVGVEGTVGPVNGSSTGVSTVVRRWSVSI